MNTEKRVKFNSNNKTEVHKHSGEQKIQRYSTDSFTKELIGKRIKISLTNNTMAEGFLKQVGMFDILVEVKATQNIVVDGKNLSREAVKSIIYLKQHIVCVEVL